MSTEGYKISKSTGFGMLMLALIFDGIQLITPGIMDTMVTAMAAIVLGMFFIEHGALTMSAKGGLRLFRVLVPFAELFISHIPGITLEVWILIKISRGTDIALPEVVHKIWGLKRLRKDVRGVKGDWKTVRHEASQIKKYAYGKGRRGTATLARKAGQHAKLAKGKAGRSIEQARKSLSRAKV